LQRYDKSELFQPKSVLFQRPGTGLMARAICWLALDSLSITKATLKVFKTFRVSLTLKLISNPCGSINTGKKR
jgi:hypothetical protein